MRKVNDEKNRTDEALITVCNNSDSDVYYGYGCTNVLDDIDNKDENPLKNNPTDENQCVAKLNSKNNSFSNSDNNIILQKNIFDKLPLLSSSYTNDKNSSEIECHDDPLLIKDENLICTGGTDFEVGSCEKKSISVNAFPTVCSENSVTDGSVRILQEEVTGKKNKVSSLASLLLKKNYATKSERSVGHEVPIINVEDENSFDSNFVDGSNSSDDTDNDVIFEPVVKLRIAEENSDDDTPPDIDLYLRNSEKQNLPLMNEAHPRYFELIENVVKGKCSIMPYFIKRQFSTSDFRVGFKCFVCTRMYFTRRKILDHLYKHLHLICPFCNKVFRIKTELTNHLTNLHYFDMKKNKIKCHHCDKEYDDMNLYLNHVNVHCKYFCGLCSNEASNLRSFIIHIKQYHSDKVVNCPGNDCSLYYFDDNEKFKEHQRKISKSGFICSSCGIAFHSKEFLKIHYEVNGKNHAASTALNYKTEIPGDGKNLDSNDNWLNDKKVILFFQDIINKKIPISKRQVPGTNKFKCFCGKIIELQEKKVFFHVQSHLFSTCFNCSKILKSIKFYEMHVKKHISAVLFNCITCNVEFNDLKTYLSHVRDHSAKRICLHCFEVFSNIKEKNHHLIKNHKDKFQDHMCDYCGKTFKFRQNLSIHIAYSHSDTKHKYVCPSCGIIADRYQHVCALNKNKELRQFICAYCSKIFHSKRSLRFHIVTHLNEKAFECHLCQKRFNRKTSLDKHIKDMHSERQWKCIYDNCTSSYTFKSALVTHMKSSHEMEFT